VTAAGTAIIGAAVSRSPEYAAARAVVEEAQRNADGRSQIGIATGLLISRQDGTREQAEGLLREAAAYDEQTILEIAQCIIEQHDSTL
jgi:AmiR/NasT family two-component response regulator